MPDQPEIQAAIQTKDPAAILQVLFEAYADTVYRLALGILRDPQLAEDVVQDTFLSAMTHLDQFEGRSSYHTWLYRIAYNFSLSQLRKRVNLPLPEEDLTRDDEIQPSLPKELVEWNWTPEKLLANQEARFQLEEAIQKLSPTLRAVFLLRDVEGLSTEDTAESLGLSDGAVKVRLHRARLDLREQLAEYFASQSEGAK